MRNYKKEYANYQGKPDQIANRSSRNKARRKLKAAGYSLKGKDVAQKNGNPRDNRRSYLSVKSESANRSKK